MKTRLFGNRKRGRAKGGGNGKERGERERGDQRREGIYGRGRKNGMVA